MNMVRFTAHSALTAWQWGPFPLVVVACLVAAAYWYLRSDWRLAVRGRNWPTARRGSFLLGLVMIDLALQSPVATFAGSYFEAHVLQHLLLMVMAPVLLALGAPSTLLLQTSNRRTKVLWLGVLRSRWFAGITNPVVVWLFYFGGMLGFFLTPLVGIAMRHMALMDVLNLAFLASGCLYWWPMVGTDPIVHWKMGYGARMLNILLGGPFEAFLGIAILGQQQPIASMYTLASTHAGGGLLWAGTELSTIGGFIPIFLQWVRSEERQAMRDDHRDDRAAQAEAAGELPGAQVLPEPARKTTAWEAMWLARTGSVPHQGTVERT
ncbi:MAG TPA: cytochrome c oxidase assembly protein [Acidimicrobiales bacterium]|nr:cytochrome c oxidase assembly protein [Acidimicrobiales bacterium]